MPSAPSRLSWEGRSTIRELAPPVARSQTDELTIDKPPLEITAGRPIVLSVATSLDTIDLLALQLTRLVV